MKKVLVILILGISIQIHSQIQVDLYFYDTCNGKIEKLEYDLFNLENEKEYFSENSKVNVDSLGTFIVSTALINGDYSGSFSKTIEIKNNDNYIDTLSIPRIRFTTETVLHSTYWNYFNCNKLCDGKEVDYYPNGNKRLEGVFNKGKPIQISEYRENGLIQYKEYYKTNSILTERVEYFDESGKLEEYEIHKNKKRKTIKMSYDAEENFLKKEVIKFYIE